MGGFHRALSELGHECVFASELDPELRELYSLNFGIAPARLHGDIRLAKRKVPRHDVLCAGFPCQPFSKSGAQRGLRDKTRGTLFHEIVDILKEHRPRFVFLENVGNFEMHDGGRTWQTVRESLERLGYDVRGTTHKASGGHGLISPHHFGHPHQRERFFILGSQQTLPPDPFPSGSAGISPRLSRVLQPARELTARDRAETALSVQQVQCINHWNEFIQSLPASTELPSFPLWGDEFGASYQFRDGTPWSLPRRVLRGMLVRSRSGRGPIRWEELSRLLPSYSRSEQLRFPDWKVRFIEANRRYYLANRKHLPANWLSRLRDFPPSLRKLEWNDKHGRRDLWNCVLQFRPSGLRAKRRNTSPALVAMTTTQIPIVGPKRRYITRIEALRLQGFPDGHQLPEKHAAAFAALGNAVHVDVIKRIARSALGL
jgi:DNA (cytosine-5)-methyltransferase 1